MKNTLEYEITVDSESILVDLPVNNKGVIELDYSHLTLDKEFSVEDDYLEDDTDIIDMESEEDNSQDEYDEDFDI